MDEHGAPLEVIISWAQFCELSKALGLDLDAAPKDFTEHPAPGAADD